MPKAFWAEEISEKRFVHSLYSASKRASGLPDYDEH